MFHVATPLELAGIAMALSVAAAGAQATARLVALHARARFDVDIDPRPLTWRSVLAWQALSLPAILTIVWLSAFDAVTGGWAVAGAVVRFSLAAVAGYGAAFLILLLAAAARQRNVRPSNPSEMLFLPSNAFFARLKARRLVLWPVVASVVRFVEARAALWPRRRGAGYINHRNGRVLPGHLANLGLLVALYTVYQLGWSFLRPPHPRVGFQLPPLAYLVLLLLAATLIVSAAAFFLDRYRVPVVSLLLLWLAWGWRSGGTDSVFAVHAPLTRAADVTAALQAADARYGSVGGLGADAPVIIVTAGGGGVHQAAWTAEVLAGLTQLWGRQFTDNLRLVSAVSGGSVGVMPYLEAFDDSGHIPPERLAAVRAAPREPATADVWWGIAYPDTLRVVLPLPLKRRLLGDFDRGWALEQAWRRGTGHAGGAATMNDWRRSVAAGARPATAFNATVVESGQRAVLATYDIPNRTAAMDLGAVTHDRDIDVTTAVRLSASFPFVTPFARANQPEGSVHVADGGYWDNHGTVAALEWLDAARPALAARRILAIDIPPLNPPPAASGERSWVWQLTAPFATLGTVRIDGQRARNDIERNWLTRAAGVDVLGVTIAYDAKDASLSWHLTRRERCAIEAAWHAYARDPEARLPALVTLLGRPSSVVITPSEECQR
jgi:hypothetical protein